MIADAIRQAQRMHRAALEQTYDGRCTVRVQKKVPKENKSTGFEEEILLENQPCRIIFKSVQAAGEAEPAAGVSQDIRMLIAPELFPKRHSGGICYPSGNSAEAF